MSAEQNKAVVRRFYEEAYNQKNLDIADELVAPNFVDHSVDPTRRGGPQGMKAHLNAYYRAFPDLRLTIEDVIASGDKVVLRYSAIVTHSDTYLAPLPPTRPSQLQAS